MVEGETPDWIKAETQFLAGYIAHPEGMSLVEAINYFSSAEAPLRKSFEIGFMGVTDYIKKLKNSGYLRYDLEQNKYFSVPKDPASQ